jgi:nicotinamidase-related amidase
MESMKLALFVIDMQNVSYYGPSKESMDKASGCINAAVEVFRENNLPIVWIQNENKKNGSIRGTKNFEIIENLKPNKNEKIIVIEYKNSFNKTELLNYVNENSIDTIIITGYSAAYCVLSTYRAAEDYDLRPIILKNAIAANVDANIQLVENTNDIMTINVLKYLIEK